MYQFESGSILRGLFWFFFWKYVSFMSGKTHLLVKLNPYNYFPAYV